MPLVPTGNAGSSMGLGNLLQNKLFLQYLSNAGGAINAGQPVGPALNQVTQQAISAQNFSKLLARILGEGGKATIDKEKTKLDMPTSLLGNLGGGSKLSDYGMSTSMGNVTGGEQMFSIPGNRQPNPFLPAL